MDRLLARAVRRNVRYFVVYLALFCFAACAASLLATVRAWAAFDAAQSDGRLFPSWVGGEDVLAAPALPFDRAVVVFEYADGCVHVCRVARASPGGSITCLTGAFAELQYSRSGSQTNHSPRWNASSPCASPASPPSALALRYATAESTSRRQPLEARAWLPVVLPTAASGPGR